jgi:N-methylhydantoinase A
MAEAASQRIVFAADIGGTFTDVFMLSPDGSLAGKKVLSTAQDPAEGVIGAILSMLDPSRNDADDIRLLRHATTVATNTILEGKGARVGLLTTEGFRDVLELRRMMLEEPYDVLYEKRPPLVRRGLRRGVPERMRASGAVEERLDCESAAREIDWLVEQGVEVIAISLINSWANPAHELALKEIVAQRHPEIVTSVASELIREIGEYERTSTVAVNSYLQPVVGRYLRTLESELSRLAPTASVQVMQSNGGLITARRAAAEPARIVESGPAAGVIAAAGIAGAVGAREVITFDMGGTTAKAAVLEGGKPRLITDYEVGVGLSKWSGAGDGGYVLRLPTIDIVEVGAGGGSIARVDVAGGLHVGPASAGAAPGPACYANGGSDATVTDANVVLGYINPAAIAGGAVPLDLRRARAVIDEDVGRPLGLPSDEAAWAVHTVANTTMISAIKAVTTKRGRDPRNMTLIAFGGSGPVHAAGIAEFLGIQAIIIPPASGLLSACGLLMGEPTEHLSSPVYERADAIDPAILQERFESLTASALLDSLGEGSHTRKGVRVQRSVDARYAGQSSELMVPVPAERVTATTMQQLQEGFHREHEQTYGHAHPEAPIEFVNVRATVTRGDQTAVSAAAVKAAADRATGRLSLSRAGARLAYFPRVGRLRTRLTSPRDLAHGPQRGPMIIESVDSTAVIPPNWVATLHRESGCVFLRHDPLKPA